MQLRRIRDAVKNPKFVHLNTQQSAILTYALYARKYNWTPQQVDEIPLDIEPWMLPVGALLDEIAEEKRDT